jgi:hypothetical protein
MAKWAYNTEDARRPGWCAWLQSVDFTGISGKSYVASGDAEFWDGGLAPVIWQRGGAVFTGGTTGHPFTFPVGPPSVGDLDVLLINFPADGPGVIPATASLPTSTAGAAWQLKTMLANAVYGAWRVATGSEPATVTVIASANTRTVLHWSRWR